MDVWSHIREQLSDGRSAANLIAFYGLIVVALVASLFLRRWLGRVRKPAGAGRQTWLEALKEEAARRARALLFWGTVGVVLGTSALGLAYHFSGGDIRREATAWLEGVKPADVFRVGMGAGGFLVLLALTRVGVWGVRRFRPILQAQVTRWLGRGASDEALVGWFRLLERYGVASVRLAALWGAGRLAGFGDLADGSIGFVFRIVTVLVLSRLLTLACRTLSRTAVEIGDRHLRKGHLQRYWDRITRLVPFGERCFDAAVYVSAASLCVGEMHFIPVVATLGDRVVGCIGILFGTRVLIELLQVLLNEAFGMYDRPHLLDQKGRTLVPLLQSVCQYVLYFGSVVLMLDVLGVNTAPILAGAGILGLAVGLGAQNLVTDVVSGFFILFEGQYLVGDYVQIGDASGTVESVGIRLTQVRDGQGKLHLIPNGQIKGVVNYSRGYINAVVDWRVPSGSDLEGVFRAMTEAGQRLKQAHPVEVLADTEIHGLVDMGASEMTVRAVTRVQPGTHGMMQNEYRRLLKQVFDLQNAALRPAVAA